MKSSICYTFVAFSVITYYYICMICYLQPSDWPASYVIEIIKMLNIFVLVHR